MNILKKIPLFSCFNEKELDYTYSKGIRKRAAKGSFIVRYGEYGDSLYLIETGSVKLTLFNKDGKVIILSTLDAGDFFGEFSLLDGQPRSCTVIAETDCDLFILTRQTFTSLLNEIPEMALNILKEMSLRLRKADKKIESLALLDVNGRVLQVLYEIASEDGKKTDADYSFDKLPTHDVIADIVGTTRESVTRAISSIRRIGILRYCRDGKILLQKKAG